MRLNYSNVLCALLLAAASVVQAAAQAQGAGDKAADAKAAGRRVMDSATGEFGLTRIGQIAVSVGDLERATAFYRDKLGMRYLFTANGMAFFDNDGIRLMLTRLEGNRTNSVIYFKVDDIRSAYRTLVNRGVKFEEQPELAAKTEKFDLWLACFKDSENNDLCLMSEVSAAK